MGVPNLSVQPYLPLYFGDFLASTAEWSGEEKALYLLLLGHQWALGSLPVDDEKIRRLAGYEKRTFAPAWKTISVKFPERDGRRYNERLEEHRQRSEEIGRKRAEVAAKSWDKRRAKDHANLEQTSQPLHKQNGSNSDAIASTLQCIQTRPDQIEESHTQRVRARALDDGHESFERFRGAYPPFAGRQNWVLAEHHYRIRLERGCSPESLLHAVEKYRRYVDSGGVSSTAHVLRPETFLSAADEPWRQPWEPPQAKPRAAAKAPAFVAPDDPPEVQASA
jgi:uncharacterized protein YdaU (DUF1376 family)